MRLAIRGIVPVLQTPFHDDGALDLDSFTRLVHDAHHAGAAAFLVPAVASEVAWLDAAERSALIRIAVASGLPVIAGCSADSDSAVATLAVQARQLGAAACLVAAPDSLRASPPALLAHLAAAGASGLPLVVQDLQFDGPGLPLDLIARIAAETPGFAGLKIETVPAGPKYTEVRRLLGNVFLSGGWAVPQLIEALDRGVDAMIPEASMVRVYSRIAALHSAGRRDEALRLFRALLPVLAYTNQELWTSVAFFKRLLVRRGIFASATLRAPAFPWDAFNQRIADELIDHYRQLESTLE